jgi:hypothetical protein
MQVLRLASQIVAGVSAIRPTGSRGSARGGAPQRWWLSQALTGAIVAHNQVG